MLGVLFLTNPNGENSIGRRELILYVVIQDLGIESETYMWAIIC
jgi:hypothetical protein